MIAYRILSLLLLSVAVVSVALNAGSLRRSFERAAESAHAMHGRGYRGNGENADSFRELVERFVPAGEDMYYCADSDDGRLQPAERSIHLSLSWAANRVRPSLSARRGATPPASSRNVLSPLRRQCWFRKRGRAA